MWDDLKRAIETQCVHCEWWENIKGCRNSSVETVLKCSRVLKEGG